MTKRLLVNFNYDLQRIPREENDYVDVLAKLASAKVVVNNKAVI